MVKISPIINRIFNKINPKSTSMKGKLPEMSNEEKLTKYIQDNIRNILQKYEQEIPLAKIEDNILDSVSLIVDKIDNNIKSVTLYALGNFKLGGISQTNFLRGTDYEIINTVGKKDFGQKLTESLNKLKDTLTKDDPLPRPGDWGPFWTKD